MDQEPLLVVSNRGPVRFGRGEDGSRTIRRGGGGLVTALTGVAARRPLVWIASALSDEDAAAAAEGPFEEGNLRVRLVVHDREEYDRYYNVFANPTLWFIHHYLWGLALAPDVDRNIRLAWDAGYVPVNRRFADAVVEELERAGEERPLVLVQDYQLFMVPSLVRERVPDVVMQHFTHIPWPLADYYRVLPPDIRTAIHQSMLACDIVGLHTERYVRNFLQCVSEFTTAEPVRGEQAEFEGRTIAVRAYPISVNPEEFDRLAETEEVKAREPSVLAARPERLIVRVDRTDPSKNVVRGFRAFEQFLLDHPEWEGRVSMLALLDPSRQDVPEYAEYLAAIQRSVRAVNDRYYSADWVPIDLRIGDDFPEAVAAYKHFDVLLVNAIFDGMNLIAKEAPLINARDGVLVLSENAGAYEELGRFALTVNPFDIQDQADAIHAALTMPVADRRRLAEGLRAHVREHDIGGWIDDQLADLESVRPGAARA